MSSNIYIKNIDKSFGSKYVLKGLNMTIYAGRTTCIMAASGAGKTTLLRILMGLEQADSGGVTGLGDKKISAVFQEERLCEYMNAIENIMLVTPSLERQTVIMELGKLGISESCEQPVSELSGGMRRRVCILRALLAEYDVLFLDEPFKGLDNDTKELVMAYVKEKTNGKTVVFVTHDSREAFVLGAEIIEFSI